MGTPIYAGPEVFLIHDREAQTYTYTCDVWSAGLILYEMLVGERLFCDAKVLVRRGRTTRS
jgi:serine/threonine protein kinase